MFTVKVAWGRWSVGPAMQITAWAPAQGSPVQCPTPEFESHLCDLGLGFQSLFSPFCEMGKWLPGPVGVKWRHGRKSFTEAEPQTSFPPQLEPPCRACPTVGGRVPGECRDEEGLPGFSSPIKVRARQPLSPRQGQSSAGWRRLVFPSSSSCVVTGWGRLCTVAQVVHCTRMEWLWV